LRPRLHALSGAPAVDIDPQKTDLRARAPRNATAIGEGMRDCATLCCCVRAATRLTQRAPPLVFSQRSLGADIIGWSPSHPMNGQNAARLPIVFGDETGNFDFDNVRGFALRRSCGGREHTRSPVRSGWSVEGGASAGRCMHPHRLDRQWRHCLPVGMPRDDREAAGPDLGQSSESVERAAAARAVAVTGYPEGGCGGNRGGGAAEGRRDDERPCFAAGG
jgi:hypothetical protein